MAGAQRSGEKPEPTRKRRSPRIQITLGELVAAAFDALGEQETDVLQVLCSRDMAKHTDRRIVLV